MLILVFKNKKSGVYSYKITWFVKIKVINVNSPKEIFYFC